MHHYKKDLVYFLFHKNKRLAATTTLLKIGARAEDFTARSQGGTPDKQIQNAGEGAAGNEIESTTLRLGYAVTSDSAA